MTLRRKISMVVAAAGLLAAALTATAAPAGASPAGWQRYEYGPFTEPAGTACAFTLTGDPVRQDVRYLTTDTYPNGDPEDQFWTGPLYIRYTNESNGKAMVGNLSGSAVIHYDPDGTQHWYVIGPFGATFHTGNPYHAAGEYILGGVTDMILHGGTVAQIAFHRGPSTDVCRALS